MAEEHRERRPQTSPPPTEQGAAGSRPVTRGQQRRQQRSVFQYITIMFAAAFVLLLFTYMMERRQYELIQEQNREQIDDLQQTVSSVQSLQGLYDENEALKERVTQLEEELEMTNSQLDQFAGAITEQRHILEMTCRALDYFWQIDEAYVRDRTTLCRDLIRELEDNQLAKFLPRDSATDNDRFSPYDRYMEIREKVIK